MPVRFGRATSLSAGRAVLAWIFFLGFVNTISGNEILELKSGHRLEGEVLRERDNALWVDIGVDIVRVPLDQIARRRPTDDSGTAPTPTADGFYLTGASAQGSVRELVARHGEGVALVETPSGLGSGFVINAKGYCITNQHVIEGETRISVTIFHKVGDEFQRKKIQDVRIVALNPFMDLALLQIPAQKDLKFAPVALCTDDQEVVVGDPVFAIGAPLGLERSVSEGIISTKNRNLRGLIYLQTTAQINPGNSGGPLFNMRGQVVGVTSMKILGGEGLGFAIPIVYLKHFLDNREAFSYDQNNPNNGYRYLEAPKRRTRRSVPAGAAPAGAVVPAAPQKQAGVRNDRGPETRQRA